MHQLELNLSYGKTSGGATGYAYKSKIINPLKKDFIPQHSIGSSLFVLGNLFPDPADFYQLSYGYQFSKKDNIIVEAITWTYYEPV